MKMFSAILSIELLFTLYLISGYMKSYMTIFHLHSPIDITLFIAMLLVFFIIKTLYQTRKINTRFTKVIALLLFFYIWMLFSSFYTSSNTYWIQKSIYFLTNIIAFIFPLIVYKSFDTTKFFKIFIILTTLLNLYFILFILPNIYTVDTFYDIAGNYLFVSLASGLNILILIILKLRYKSVYFSSLILLINFFTMLSSGGRGGIIFTFLILILYFLVKVFKIKSFKMFSKKNIKYFTILIIVTIGGTLYLGNNNVETNELFERSFNRLELLNNAVNSGNAGSSVNVRLDLMNFSIDKSFNDIPHFLFGYGIGSFSTEYHNIDGKEYPHNIILEILFELGIVGLFLFIFYYFYIIKKYRYTSLIWLVVYMTLHVLKSSGLTDIRLFFAILALMIINSINKKENYANDKRRIK